jgi:uncharacterized membrane protein YdbT with pleckstrin-like domain
MAQTGNGAAASAGEAEKLVAEFRGSTVRWLFGSFAGWGTVALCLVGIGLVIAVFAWWRNISTLYQLTNQRLVIRRGVIMKSEDEIELFRVKDVRVTYSLANQVTDIGNIEILSTDPTTHHQVLRLQSIPGARALREEIRKLVNAARRTARVREVDFDLEGQQ